MNQLQLSIALISFLEANISPIEKRWKIMGLTVRNQNKCGWFSTTAK